MSHKVKNLKMADYFTIASSEAPAAGSLEPPSQAQPDQEELPPQIKEQLVERLE